MSSICANIVALAVKSCLSGADTVHFGNGHLCFKAQELLFLQPTVVHSCLRRAYMCRNVVDVSPRFEIVPVFSYYWNMSDQRKDFRVVGGHCV